jgi:hypothetical protein
MYSQTDTTFWKTGGDFSFQINQSYFDNWAAGGERSWAMGSILNGFAKYNDGVHSWDNTLFMGIGYIGTQGADARKTDDKIELNSKYGRQAYKKFSYAAQMNFKTQMLEGIDVANGLVLSDFMAPAYLNLSLGMDYKPDDRLSVFYSPLSGRIIFVMNDSLSDIGAYGVKKGQKIRPELGSYFVVQSKYELVTNIFYQSKLDMFWNYTPENADKDLFNIDVMWDNSLMFKVNSILSFIITANIIYDHDIYSIDEDGKKHWLQLKQTLGAGITIKY